MLDRLDNRLRLADGVRGPKSPLAQVNEACEEAEWNQRQTENYSGGPSAVGRSAGTVACLAPSACHVMAGAVAKSSQLHRWKILYQNVCLGYGLQPYRHLTGEAHGLTVRLYDILDMWRIAASHGGHDWNAGTTTGGQDIGIALPESF